MKVYKGPSLSRRGFLRLATLGLGNSFFHLTRAASAQPAFTGSDPLGRVAVGKVDVKSRPDVDSQTSSVLYEDAVVLWLREVVGRNPYRTNQRWVETPDGYIWSPYLQPVGNTHNSPVKALPEANVGTDHRGETGMWVEVSLPYIDLRLDNPPPRSPGLQDRQNLELPFRLYYSQILWVDRLKTDDQGQVWYRINERYGTYGDILWGAAEAFRPITAEEIAPISPEVEDKHIEVNIIDQSLACYEGKTEVYYTRISSGALYNSKGERVDVWATPIGSFPIWRKLVSLHMSGGTTGGGWDLPGVGWTSLFVGSGIAVHSTFWHNNFGEPMSRGCINARPEDAKWVFRWSQPFVNYNPGDATIGWPGGTKVNVIET